ncbi:MAG: GAF domain-containing protein [Bacillota bacterium]
MASLTSIKRTAQQTAEAISAALHVHVEISDDNLECVAGTGEFAKLIGTKLKGYIHSRVLSSGKFCVIENPGYHEFCRQCPHLKNCYATAEICVPIFKGKTPVGVIGLVSMDEEQKERLTSFQEQNVNFLEKMSDLLSSKLKEIELLEKEKFLNNQLEMVINFVDQGVIASDEYGNITHINHYAQKVVGEGNVIGKRLTTVMPVEKIKNMYLSNKYFKQEKFDLRQKNRNLRVIGNAHPVIVDNKNSGVVLSFRAISDALRMFHEANSSLQYGFEDIIGTSRPLLEVKEKAKKNRQF